MKRILMALMLCIAFTGCKGSGGADGGNVVTDTDMGFNCYNATYGDSIEEVKSIEGLEYYNHTEILAENDSINTFMIMDGDDYKGIQCDYLYYFENNELRYTSIGVLDNEILTDFDKAKETVEFFDLELSKEYTDKTVIKDEEDEDGKVYEAEYTNGTNKVALVYKLMNDSESEHRISINYMPDTK